MKNYTLLFVIVSLCCITCSKEDKNESPKEDEPENLCYSSTLISQVNLGDSAVHGLTYNSECLIYESTEPYQYKKFSYDSRNILNKIEMANTLNAFSCMYIPGQSRESDPRKAKISQYSEFQYDDALRLIKKSNYYINNGNPQLNSYLTYDYENNKIVKSSAFNTQGGLIQYNEYKYDDNGNITRDDKYSNNSVIKLVKTMLYEFDNKNNPYQVFACEGNPGKDTNKNNIIKETTVTYNGSTGSSTTKQIVYEYNNLDYPVKINDLLCIYGKLQGN
jgi:hypothetical protein